MRFDKFAKEYLNEALPEHMVKSRLKENLGQVEQMSNMLERAIKAGKISMRDVGTLAGIADSIKIGLNILIKHF
jgi:hypothetical protein